jgi:N-acetylglucosaminyldiphosphoundecaprenol N-acetyl-beta-D-mannosaminyltransferase
MARELLRHVTLHPDAISALNQVKLSFERKTTHILSFLNAHAFNLAVRDQAFRDALLGSHFLFRDGIGLKIAAIVFGQSPGANLNGTDFIPSLISSIGERRIALYGSAAGVAEMAAKQWKEDFSVSVVDTADGFQGSEFYLNQILKTQPEVVILGMGMPKQEKLAMQIAAQPLAPMLIVNGGAIFDFVAHVVPRAPRWIQSIGFEWLFRLSQEPIRLFQRYVVGNPIFLFRIFWLRFFSRD